MIAYHPTCDIALVESDNRGQNFPKMGLVYQDQPVTTYGVSASGDVISGYGHYRMDLNFVNYRYFKECPASIMDAPIQAGMSGGGTFNSRGDLVALLPPWPTPKYPFIEWRSPTLRTPKSICFD